MRFFSLILWLLLASPSLALEIKAPYVMPVLLSLTKSIYPDPLWEGDTNEKLVALTFDDGPSQFTPHVLDVLKEEQVSAAFFVLGNRFPNHENTIKRMHREGHLIGLHGMTHIKLHGQSEKWIQQNINDQKKLIQNHLGANVNQTGWYYRPPFGAMSGRILRVLNSSDVRVVLCSILPGQQIFKKMLKPF